MRMKSVAKAEGEPILSLNTTPLIDVLLVLLIMLIMTLPPLSHKLPVDLPQGGLTLGDPPPVNRIDLAANGALSWNGAPVTVAGLDQALKAHVADDRGPTLHFAAAAEGSYDRFHQTLKHVKMAGVTKLGFVGNAQHRSW